MVSTMCYVEKIGKLLVDPTSRSAGISNAILLNKRSYLWHIPHPWPRDPTSLLPWSSAENPYIAAVQRPPAHYAGEERGLATS